MFASLDAVKHKRVYKFPQFNRSPDAAEIISPTMARPRRQSPALPQGREFPPTIRASYQLIYHKALTAEQVRDILELDQNQDSAGYHDIFG